MQALVVVVAVLAVGRCHAADVCERVGTDTLRCKLRTLDSVSINTTQLSGVKTADIVCSNHEHLHDESELAFVRAFLNLESLSLEHCKFGKIRSESFKHLRGLKIFKLRTFQSEWLSDELKLEDGCFDGMNHLEELDISENNIWNLNVDVFKSLVSLKKVNFSGNHMQELSMVTASGVSPNILVLDLSRNNIATFPASAMKTFPSLQQLHLKSNSLKKIEEAALEGLASLEVLDMSYNELKALPAMLLNETRQLRQLQLHNNSISVLPPGLLADMPHLQTVNMSSNRLTSQWIRKDTFAGLFRLIVLDLSTNALESLSRDAFGDLSSLQVLDLSHNQLQSLPDGVFSPLSNLHALALSGNLLSRLGPESLASLDVLSRLRLDSNRLVSIADEAFSNITGVQDLQLQHNSLTRLPRALQQLTSLLRLDIGDNAIRGDTEGVLKPLKHLNHLSLAGNRLHNVSIDFLSSQTQLAMLDLSRNEISSVESGALERASKLRAIRLDANKLRNINGLFAKLPELLWLNVSDNQIEFFDYALIPGALRWLDLHKNQLREIGNFYNIESKIELETLDISHNQVSLITRASVPDGIKYFIMASNQLATVEPGTFEAKYQLVRADLSGNQLERLGAEAVTLPAGGGEHAAVLLAGNPLSCDCTMEWLLANDSTRLEHSYPKALDGDRIMCRLLHSPHSLTPLPKTKPNDFLCTYERHCFALCHCCNYVACDCEMKCPDGCTCYHDHFWNTNIVDCSHREQVAISREIPMDATAVFADGNNIHSIDSHTFIGRKRIRHLYVNNSNVEEVQNRSLSGLTSLKVLRLESNVIKTLHGFEFDGLRSLRELYLHNNQLTTIHPTTFSHLSALEVLTLRNNQLATFPVWQLASNSYLVQISLSNNPWSCACLPASRLERYIIDNRAKIEDVATVQCDDSGAVVGCQVEHAPPAIRRVGAATVWPFVLLSVGIVAVSLLAVVLVLRFRSRLCPRKPPVTPLPPAYGVAVVTGHRDKLYDVFVTYSAQDTRFVNEVLTAELEQAAPAHRLCLLRRDAPNTSYLGDAVHHCVTTSSKTLIVVSRNFLDNEWCRFDFKASHLEALRSSGDIVVLLYGVERSAVEGELRALLKGAACVTYGEPDCWRKLRGLLPERNTMKNSLHRSLNNRSCVVHALQEKNFAHQSLGLPVTMYALDSPSSTYSTEVSDDTSGGLPTVLLDPARMLPTIAQQQLNTSCGSLNPSEHTYMYIDQYRAAPPAASDRQIYSTPEVESPMPCGLHQPAFFCQSALPPYLQSSGHCHPGYDHWHVEQPSLHRQRSLQPEQGHSGLGGHPVHQLQSPHQGQQQPWTPLATSERQRLPHSPHERQQSLRSAHERQQSLRSAHERQQSLRSAHERQQSVEERQLPLESERERQPSVRQGQQQTLPPNHERQPSAQQSEQRSLQSEDFHHERSSSHSLWV